jgi:hypothetical protein
MNIGTDKLKRTATAPFFCAIVPDNVCGQLQLILLISESLWILKANMILI